MRSFLALFLGLILGLTVLSWSPPAGAGDGVQLAQGKSHICFKDCIDTNGADNKAACARQCGLAGGLNQPQRDCGKILRACIKGCGKDRKCKSRCRKANLNCV
ncbi:MAG: hypothetical protein ISR52_07330 [Rhodospirillales bacterium]|nr:hypothetical protein [Rhodospirillales bacterium]